MKQNTIYGKVETEWKKTFEDENAQRDFIKDFREMLGKVDDDKFFNMIIRIFLPNFYVK